MLSSTKSNHCFQNFIMEIKMKQLIALSVIVFTLFGSVISAQAGDESFGIKYPTFVENSSEIDPIDFP